MRIDHGHFRAGGLDFLQTHYSIEANLEQSAIDYQKVCYKLTT